MGKQAMVTIARSALVKGYASTVVDAISARIVEGVKYAITVVNAVSARNVEGHQYASTVVYAVGARIAEGRRHNHKKKLLDEDRPTWPRVPQWCLSRTEDQQVAHER